jgi:hypothetical protein
MGSLEDTGDQMKQTKIGGTLASAPKRILILATLVFLSSAPSVKAYDVLPGWEIIMATCLGLPSGVACVCGNQAGNLGAIESGDLWCSYLHGRWVRNFPMPDGDVRNCPFRIQRGAFPVQDGRCGSRFMNTANWLPQKFLGIVPFDRDVCKPHDAGYSDCGVPKEDTNAAWLRNTSTLCNAWLRGIPKLFYGCLQMGTLYHTAFTLIGGESSYQQAQKENCQCGPNVDCMGGIPRICINCLGEGGGVLPCWDCGPGDITTPPCGPGNDFC